MKLEELKDEEMYVFVAPDGSPQLSTLAPDYAMCVAFCELLASKKISESPRKLFREGFEVLRVKVNMSQLGDAEAAFQAAKEKLG
jgi:hypothetical protein